MLLTGSSLSIWYDLRFF